MVLALVVPAIIGDVLQSVATEELVMDSRSSTAYKSWQRNDRASDIPVHYDI